MSKAKIVEVVGNQTKLEVSYDPLMVSGRELFNEAKAGGEGVEVFNLRVAQLENCKERELEVGRVVRAFALILIFLLFDLVFPEFSWMESAMTWPEREGSRFRVMSVYLILNYALTLLSMHWFGLQTYRNAFSNYVNFRIFNMETLITLGSLSAFLLSLFELGQAITYNRGGHMEVMLIADSLMSTALILCIVSVGKFFEEKAKLKIAKMTKEIFP